MYERKLDRETVEHFTKIEHGAAVMSVRSKITNQQSVQSDPTSRPLNPKEIYTKTDISLHERCKI